MLYRDSCPAVSMRFCSAPVAYGSMTVGAFAVLAALNRPERLSGTVDDLAGLSRTHPCWPSDGRIFH